MRTLNGRNREPAFRQGASTVEFAVVLPTMLMILFGAIEFSRTNQVVNATAFSAYQGCRQAIIPGGSAAAATAAVQQSLSAVSISGATITVTPSTITDDTTTVTVVVSVNLSSAQWIPPTFTQNMTITRSCTLTREKTT